MAEAAGTRLVFANQLRGVAACMVLLAHYTIVVHVLRPNIAWVVGAPPLEGPVPAITYWVQGSPVDIGATAVSLFFLISGFVIPFSLQALGGGRFLLARAWRILPTFWVALALGGLAVFASSSYWQRDVPFHWPDYAVNGLLLQTWLGRTTVDWVSWTLSVEVKFYLLAALCRPLLLRCGVRLALCWALVVLAVCVGARQGVLRFSDNFVSEAIYLPYMLIGAMFHAHLAGRMRTRGLLGGAALVMLLVVGCWRLGPLAGETVARSLALLFALGLFGAAYAGRGRFRRNRALDGMAAISYPLYLVHALMGFPLLSFLMMAWNVPYALAAPLTLAVVISVAALVHVAVELPSTRVGRWMARLQPARRAAA